MFPEHMLRQARAIGARGASGLNWRRAVYHQQLLQEHRAEEAVRDDVPWLFVGVGNPGAKFLGTRHNVGFEMIDAVSQAEGIALNRFQHRAIIGEGSIGGMPVMLAKPQTYANLIGESIALLLEHHGLPAEKIVVLLDDMETRLAKLCFSQKGGHGNHRGLINLIAHLKGNRNFTRLRIGIGSPPEKMDAKAYVLQKFCVQERKMMDSSIIQGVEIIRRITTTGVDKVTNVITKPGKYL